MKVKIIKAFAIAAFLIAGAQNSFAKEAKNYDWIIRGRALYVKANTSSQVTTLGGNVSASSDVVPEIDVTRFITPNVAVELIAATTQHNIALKDSAVGPSQGLGTVKLLPPTLTLQYHTNPTGKVRPYFGGGLNYTFFYGAKTGGIATSMKYQDHLGYAIQAGFDYMLTERLGLNFDIKKIFLKTNVQVNNTYTAQVRLDPWLVGAGVSYRF